MLVRVSEAFWIVRGEEVSVAGTGITPYATEVFLKAERPMASRKGESGVRRLSDVDVDVDVDECESRPLTLTLSKTLSNGRQLVTNEVDERGRRKDWARHGNNKRTWRRRRRGEE